MLDPAEPKRPPKRILLVEANEDGTTGGSHRALVDLATHLDRRRFEPVILFYEHNDLESELAGVEVHVWDTVRSHERSFHGPVGMLRQAQGVVPAIVRRARFLHHARIDLVHLNNAPVLGMEDWLPAALVLRTPCISHVRGEFSASRRWPASILVRSFDRVLPVSRCMASVARAAGIGDDRITTVYDGVDCVEFRRRVQRDAKEMRASLGVREDDTLVVQVAHLRTWKGHDLVLDALARLTPSRLTKLRVMFVGAHAACDETWAQHLRARRVALGLERQVEFLGARADVPDLLNAADLLLHASVVPEPFGLVLVEAMALGRPVLASRIGGPVEILTSDCGVAFEPGSAQDLAMKLEALLADDDLRRRLGQAAKARAETFDVSSTARSVETVYAEALRLQTHN